MLADFDPAVSWVVPQSVLLEATAAGVQCRHVPDFLLITGDGPTVVEVKPARQTAKRIFAWPGVVVESRGWRYEVWHDTEPALLADVRFLAGHRRPQHVHVQIVDALPDNEIAGMAIGEVISDERRWPSAMVRAALTHMFVASAIHRGSDATAESRACTGGCGMNRAGVSVGSVPLRRRSRCDHKEASEFCGTACDFAH